MDKLTQLLMDLVSIDSINPDLVPGGAGEAEVARFIAGWCSQAGLEVHLDEVRPGRPNVVAVARGTGGGQSLMLNGHIDVVGAGGMENPFQPFIKDGRLYGRGVYDMKAGLAAQMLAAAQARQLNLRGDVILTGVMDEEFAGLGTLDIAQKYRADAAVIAEPTDMELIVAHRGFTWLEIETHGVAAHGSRPDLGVDAISLMGRVLVALEGLNKQLLSHASHPLLKSGSLHSGLINGGHEISTYPERCVLSLERRTLPGETPELVTAQIQAILDRLAAEDPTFKASLRCGLSRPPMETPVQSPVVELMQQATAAVMGRPASPKGIGFWTDAASLAAVGIPSVLYGPMGKGAHAVEEWVELSSVQQCAEVYLHLIQAFCQ
jgi:acetylornithine deacetylase